LTIVDSLGNQLDMGTKFDYFGIEGYHTYAKHSPEILANRTLLKATMYAVGFRHIRTEWWHYSYMKASYPISDWLWDCEVEE
jgi:D-alanyl-D-alanine dipeptidase